MLFIVWFKFFEKVIWFGKLVIKFNELVIFERKIWFKLGNKFLLYLIFLVLLLYVFFVVLIFDW